MNITCQLLSMRDGEYKQFHQKLIPNINPDTVIGIRAPALRKFAADLYKSGGAQSFLKQLPHSYYEENNLHAFLTEKIKDFDTALYETERFLPYIDNWATCDCFCPRVFKKNPQKLKPYVYKWLNSGRVYTVRYAIGCLMKIYLDGELFDEDDLSAVSKIKTDEYYINMMIAWYFATALAKQYESTVKYLKNKLLPVWMHNKTIQKAVESYRIDNDTKAYLKTLKIKKVANGKNM